MVWSSCNQCWIWRMARRDIPPGTLYFSTTPLSHINPYRRKVSEFNTTRLQQSIINYARFFIPDACLRFANPVKKTREELCWDMLLLQIMNFSSHTEYYFWRMVKFLNRNQTLASSNAEFTQCLTDGQIM